MGNTVLLSRIIPSLFMLVTNCSASGEQQLSVFEVCGHLLSQLLFLRLSYSVALLWGIVSVHRKHNFDMPAPEFQLNDNFSREWGDDFDLDLFCFLRRFVCC